jgi:hypothetical protein
VTESTARPVGRCISGVTRRCSKETPDRESAPRATRRLRPSCHCAAGSSAVPAGALEPFPLVAMIPIVKAHAPSPTDAARPGRRPKARGSGGSRVFRSGRSGQQKFVGRQHYRECEDG